MSPENKALLICIGAVTLGFVLFDILVYQYFKRKENKKK